jgi:hypothetical protein
MVWNSILEDGSEVGEEVIKEAIHSALGKFWYYGKLRGSITIQDWKKGVLGRLGFANRMLKAMTKCGLVEEIPISGVSEGGIAFCREAVPDLQQFMDNRQLVGRVRDLFADLAKELRVDVSSQ